MKIKMAVKQLSTGSIWFEEYEIDNDKDPVVFCTDLIQKFNSALRHGESPREFIGVEITEEETCVLHNHSWEKQNLVTVFRGTQSYDAMKCERCGITGKRYGLSAILRDSKYKGKVYDKCETALAQLEKNKQRKRSHM